MSCGLQKFLEGIEGMHSNLATQIRQLLLSTDVQARRLEQLDAEIENKKEELAKAVADVELAQGAVEGLDATLEVKKFLNKVTDAVSAARSALKDSKLDKKTVAVAHTVGAKLVDTLNKANNLGLDYRLIRWYRSKNAAIPDAALVDRASVTLGSYFEPVSSKDNVMVVDEILADKEDGVGYKGMLRTVEEGLTKLFTDGEYKIGRIVKGENVKDVNVAGEKPGYESISQLLFSHRADSSVKSAADTMHRLPKEVSKAIAVATLDVVQEYMAEIKADVRTDAGVRSLLNISDPKTEVTPEMRDGVRGIDGIIAMAANRIGDKAFRYLALRGKNVPGVNTEQLAKKMAAELGLMGIYGLANSGVLTVYKSDIDGMSVPTYRLASSNDGAQAADMPWEGYVNGKGPIPEAEPIIIGGVEISASTGAENSAVLEAVEYKKDKVGVYKTAEDAANDDIRNKGISGMISDVSTEHKEAVKKQSATAYRFAEGYEELLRGLMGGVDDEAGRERLAIELGWTDPEEVHVSKVESVQGQNREIRAAVDNLFDAYSEFGKGEMFARWEVITNNRFMIQSNKLNWQDKKLHRHAVYTKKVNVKKHLKHFKLAVGQGLGIDVDKMSLVDAIKEIDSVLDEVKNILLSNGNDVTKAWKEWRADNKNAEVSHAMMSFTEAVGWIKAQQNGEEDAYESGLRLETDAITSGYILKLLVMPVFAGEKLYEELARGGVTNTDIFDYNSYGDRASGVALDNNGNRYKDSYEEPAQATTEEFSKVLSNKRISKVDKEGLLAGLEMLGSEVEDGVLKKAKRVMFKYPFMTLNYGSAVGSIVSSMATSTLWPSGAAGTRGVAGLMEDIANGAFDEDVAVEKIEALIRLLHGDKTAAAEKHIKEFREAIGGKDSVSEKALRTSILKYDPFSREQMYVLKDKLVTMYKEPITNVFEQKYGEVIKSVKVTNSAATAQFRLGKIVLDRKIQEKIDDRRTKYSDGQIKRYDRLVKQREAIDSKIEKLRKYTEYLDMRGKELVADNETAGKKGKASIDKSLSAINAKYTKASGQLAQMEKTREKRLQVITARLETAPMKAIAAWKKSGKAEGKPHFKVSPLTEKEVNTLIKELSSVFPVFKSVLNMDDGTKAKIFIAKRAKVRGVDYDGVNMSTQAQVKFEGKTHASAVAEVYGIIEAFSSGSVIPIHFMDGSLQARVLSKMEALGVHDANYAGIDMTEKVTKAYNQAVYELSREYSLGTEMLESFVSTIESSSKEDIVKYTKAEQYKVLEGKAKVIDWLVGIDMLTSDDVAGGPDAVLSALSKLQDPGAGRRNKNAYDAAMGLKDKLYAATLGLEGILSQLVEQQKLAEEGRVELFNNGKMRFEHSYLDGAEFVPDLEKYGTYEAKTVYVRKVKARLAESVETQGKDGTIDENVHKEAVNAAGDVADEKTTC